jgi:5-(carboxyamino)imidazole ribonucleotide synthase
MNMETHHNNPDPPRIGILGGGQLGRMTALAAIRMGLLVRTLSPELSAPVEGLGETVIGDWRSSEILSSFGKDCSVVTVESEWAPADIADDVLKGRIPVYPRPATLRSIRHKGVQKTILDEAGVPQAPYRLCRSLDHALDAGRTFGYPVVLKKYEGSYDGYGNSTANCDEDLKMAWSGLHGHDGLLVEGWVSFRRELATLVARRPGGEYVVYPLVHTEQRDHRCHAVSVPAGCSSVLVGEAKDLAVRAAEAVDVVGILAVELFETEEGRLLINELAPRPHNTGHYTIEACHTSQFENHVRAIMDWPLGSPDLAVPAAVMVNILGSRDTAISLRSYSEALDGDGGSIHIYGKSHSRPGRKMGHVTVTSENVEFARSRAESIVSRILI